VKHLFAPRSAAPALLAAAAALLAFAGCYPDSPESVEDLDVVVSAKVPGADYVGLATFAMQDTVIVLDIDDETAEPIDPGYNAVILDQLRASMVAAGFTDVTADTATVTPDAWLVCGAVQSEVWYYYYYWGYWGDWWYPGWGYYPPAVGVDSFTQGTVLWQLMDVRGVDPADPDATVDPLWIAGLTGAARSTTGSNEQSIRDGIRQAFAQSPYIQAGSAGN
jgi:hypothetical protein